MRIPIEVSARHVHLSKKDLEKLFGKNYKLKVLKKLSQPGQFASKETVTLINQNNKIENVRILGPTRKNSQVEISITDAIKLKIKPVIKLSGNLFNTPKISVKTKKGTVKINAIVAKRHLHISEIQAKKLKLKNHQEIKIKTKGKRELIFEKIIVRVDKNFDLAFQIDTDEANAAGIYKKCFGKIVK